jgi:2-keto-4-pentenoate hydratase
MGTGTTVSPSDLIDAFGREMFRVFRHHELKRETTDEIASISLADAYQVQSRALASRVREGERQVGWKVGCTSRAIQEQFGLTQPISGHLMEPHIHHDGAVLSALNYVDCAVEPEMVFCLGRDLVGDVDTSTAAEAIGTVAAGIELHNYRFWYGKPTSQELIASNGIHAGLVVGAHREFHSQIDLSMEGVGVWVNGRLEASGIGAEIMSGPLDSLCWLARHVAEQGTKLRAGELVIPGSAVKLVRVRAGDQIESRFTSLGGCHASLA